MKCCKDILFCLFSEKSKHGHLLTLIVNVQRAWLNKACWSLYVTITNRNDDFKPSPIVLWSLTWMLLDEDGDNNSVNKQITQKYAIIHLSVLKSLLEVALLSFSTNFKSRISHGWFIFL